MSPYKQINISLGNIVNPDNDVALGEHALSLLFQSQLDWRSTRDDYWHAVLTAGLGRIGAKERHGA